MRKQFYLEETFNRTTDHEGGVGARSVFEVVGGRTPCVEYPMSKPLRAEIHEVITSYLQARIATGEHVDGAEMTQQIAQSLVDVIMEPEEDGHAALFAFALTSLGEEYFQRHGVFDTKPKGH